MTSSSRYHKSHTKELPIQTSVVYCKCYQIWDSRGPDSLCLDVSKDETLTIPRLVEY